MKPEEIRPGNYLELFGRVKVKGVYLPEGHTRYHIQTEDYRDTPLEEFKPVTILEEHLFYAGLEKEKLKHKDGSITDVTYWLDNQHRLQWYDDGKINDKIDTGELMFIHEKKGYITFVKYLHELQNLCMDLKIKFEI